MSIGVVLGVAIDWLLRTWQRRQSDRRRSEAVHFLKKHGLSPQLYLASIGVDDPELRRAIDEFAYSGHLIVNAQNEVVGKLCPRVVKGPHLRLIVSSE